MRKMANFDIFTIEPNMIICSFVALVDMSALTVQQLIINIKINEYTLCVYA